MKTNVNTTAASFFSRQMTCWPETAARFEALRQECRIRELPLEHSHLRVQYNPARTVSNKAQTDKASIEKRPCFLCAENRPSQQLSLEIRSGYQLLVNPFPILPEHFTIAANEHRPQQILKEFAAFRDFLDLLPQYIVFYNGPQCGASAPDHQHFQAGSKGCVPIEAKWKTDYEPYLSPICPARVDSVGSSEHYGLFLLSNYPAPVFVLRAHKAIELTPLFRLLYQTLPCDTDASEPMLNLIGWQGDEGEQTILVFPRSKHRPDDYYKEGEKHMSISPGAIDMGGLLITVSEEDYNKITPAWAQEILAEVSLSQEQMNEVIGKIKQQVHPLPDSEPKIQVGILSRPYVTFTLHEPYNCEQLIVSGEQQVSCIGNELVWNGRRYPELVLTPERKGRFSIPNVTIGIRFHWQKEEQQTFLGGIRLVPDQGQVVLINHIDVEDYLSSVISSEMNADCPFEFLKASAIISRSWILSQLRHKQQTTASNGVCGSENEHEIIRWYERNDHRLFDVCADDHCQRYQGIGRITSNRSIQAVTETRGEVLLHDYEICDARFSKCCGGMTEKYASCWEDTDVPYLTAHTDRDPSAAGDLHEEDKAHQWIESRPDCFCNTDDRELLQQILNNYDQTTNDFFRWEVSYNQQDLAELIRRKSDIDFGDILDLTPIERGPGGHLVRLLITGSRCSRIIGKELEIRRILSKTHLYSSAFHVIRHGNGPVPEGFTLRGAGWGHGVGMCQIGAAVMGKKGYGYRQILQHYYPHTEIKKLY